MPEKNFKTLLPHIKLMVFDVDGVLSDGSIHCFNDGEQLRVLNIKDGYALQLAIKKGIRILIISGGKSEAVVKRLNLFEHKISLEETLYMGDDIPDMECLKHVAASTCPADAANDIKPICLYVSQLDGGKGCVRDVIEQVLKAQHKWLDADAHTW